ncbi:MAG: DNA polymerase/3'-5' exonuclease PolX [Coriobacteriia bacterium]|nr:DNA polymerase/3'-5' exonuclease PolX [Coriobacteriia bacterium]
MPEYDNPSVAKILDTVGDLLEISGADKFRFLSYHKAAHALRAFPEEVMTLARDGRLTEVPGVGSKLAASIITLTQTGSFPELDAITDRLPGTLVDLTRIPGLGPKKVKVLYEQLDVTSVDALEAAIEEGRLAGLAGFGAKTIDNLAEGIVAYRRHSERRLMADVLPLAERIVAAMRDVAGVTDIAYAGSLRRRRDTVGDIDVVVASGDPESVMEAARTLPRVERVLVSGDTKTSIATADGLQIDVRVVSPDQYGAALQYFTGSAEHNSRLRELAKRSGLKVNEYGVFRLADDAAIASATEADVYTALGMDVPVPELRENAGEIEAALAGDLPGLLEGRDIRGDLHMHTVATDGKSTARQNRAKAAALGYEYIAITDHAVNLHMVGGLGLDALERQWEEIDELNSTGDGPHVLKGVELNIDDDGQVDYDLDVLARFDIVLASLHSGWGQSREVATRRVLRAMDNPFIDVIAHLTGRILCRRDPIDLDIEAVMQKAAQTGTALELNSYPDRLDLSDVHLRMAKRTGVAITLGTDSHDAAQLDYMSYGVGQARRGWIEPGDVLNTLPLHELRLRLKRARSL